MKSIDDLKRRELELWLEFVSRGVSNADSPADAARTLEKRGWFCLAEFESEDYRSVSDDLLTHDANAGFAFLGREATEKASVIEELHSRGHEIVFHGHRHHAFDDLSYDQAHEYVSTGIECIEDATGITPTGLFTPMSETSEEALEALTDLGFEWVVGSTDTDDITEELSVLNPEKPYDDHFFEVGDTPEQVFERYNEWADEQSTFVFHPPYHVHYGATDAFERWVGEVGPVSVSERLANGGPGLILDCARPLQIV